MAADGEDFTRRKPLYGKVYRLSKEGRDLLEIAPCAVKGMRKEIASRPLHAFKEACSLLASQAAQLHQGGHLFANDQGFMAAQCQSELDAIGAKHQQHDSTRHVLEAAGRIQELIIQQKLGRHTPVSEEQIGELIVHDLFKQLVLDPMKNYHAFNRGLDHIEGAKDMETIMSIATSDLQQLAKDLQESPSARKNRKSNKGAIDNSPQSLESEDISL